MQLNKFSPIVKQFIGLVKSKLDIDELAIFGQVIDELYQSLDSGNSCLIIDAKNHSQNIEQILAKTELLAVYHTELPNKLNVLPFSLWHVAGKQLLFLTRYLAYEKRIYSAITQLFADKLTPPKQLPELLNSLTNLQQQYGLPNQEQLQSIIESVSRRFNIITGGPGTGKTTTVTLLLWTLYQIYGNNLKVKICAPTGKAAIRVKSSIVSSIENLKTRGIDTTCFADLLADNTNFGTIHKLLGTCQDSIYFRHDADNPLDVEVLIVDESSMVGLPLFSKLITAIDTSQIKHIILLGDKNQLSSVEEGYVFASLVNLELEELNKQPRDLFDISIVRPCSELRVSNRNNQLIANLAMQILHGQTKELSDALSTQKLLLVPKIRVLLDTVLNAKDGIFDYINKVMAKSQFYQQDTTQLFKLFTTQTTLCATNSGLLGTDNLNKQIEQQIKQSHAINSEWYTGRAVMVLQNDYSLDLFNGDIGICIIMDNQPRIYFENGKVLIPEILPKHSLAYAITIHKSQGSEYRHVNVVLPPVADEEKTAFYSRELFYTAITRAKTSVTIFSDEATLESTIANQTMRNSGIGYMK